jgi:hypothetical protein
MLVHHPNPQRSCGPRSGDAPGNSVQTYVTPVGALESIHNVHESGFAGSVLSQERVNLTRVHEKIDPAQCMHGAKALVDSGKLQRRRHSEPGGMVVEIPVDVELLGKV